jgi:hypothetical protein
MAVDAQYVFKLKAIETLDNNRDLSTPDDGKYKHEIPGAFGTATATTTPAVTDVWSKTVTLSAGASTIDLTVLDNGDLANLDLTGKKVYYAHVKAAAANTADLTIGVGATNGYPFPGVGSSDTVDLGAGDEMLFRLLTSTAVSSTVKTIDAASTDVDAIFDIVLVAG